MNRKLRKWGETRGRFDTVHEYVAYKQGRWSTIFKTAIAACLLTIIAELIVWFIGGKGCEWSQVVGSILALASWLFLLAWFIASCIEIKWSQISLFAMRTYENFIKQGTDFETIATWTLNTKAEQETRHAALEHTLIDLVKCREVYGKFYLKPNMYRLTVKLGFYALADSLIFEEVAKHRAKLNKQVAISEKQVNALREHLANVSKKGK